VDLLHSSSALPPNNVVAEVVSDMPHGTDGKGGAVEKVTLHDVTDQGGVLILEDGRSLRVHPGDTSSTVFWMPTTALEISRDDASRLFPLNIHNTVIRSDINAAWTTQRP
jgi:hypothetical protein